MAVLYFIKELDNLMVKGRTPKFAIKKAIRLLVRKVREKRGDIFELRNQRMTITDINNNVHEYTFSVVKPSVHTVVSVFYQLDYDIELWKKLNNI